MELFMHKVFVTDVFQKPKTETKKRKSSQRKKTAQNTSKKRKNVETESPGSSATRQQPKRLASEDSVLSSDSSSSSRSSYGLKDLPSSASKFTEEDSKALNAAFQPASRNKVIPDVEGKNCDCVNNPPIEPILRS